MHCARCRCSGFESVERTTQCLSLRHLRIGSASLHFGASSAPTWILMRACCPSRRCMATACSRMGRRRRSLTLLRALTVRSAAAASTMVGACLNDALQPRLLLLPLSTASPGPQHTPKTAVDCAIAGRFVQRLRQEAAAVPNVTVRQGVVKRLLDGVQLLCCLGLVHLAGSTQDSSLRTHCRGTK